MIKPDPLFRDRFGGQYEVLSELTEMWYQADKKAQELADNLPENIGASNFNNAGAVISQMSAALGKREAWRDAIAVYAGFSEHELVQYMAGWCLEKEQATNVG